VKSITTPQFRQMFADLPKQIQDRTRRAYRQFQQDPSYPSLRFKKVHPKLPIYSVRINKDYRAVGQLDEDLIVWFWVGSHAEYDLLLDNF
jgi:mRNA-degrading endonuclease RelE of RelBE toxin-antitoxin system